MTSIRITKDRLTQMARRLASYLKEHGELRVKHSHAMGALATALGYNEHSLAAALKNGKEVDVEVVDLDGGNPMHTTTGWRAHYSYLWEKLHTASRNLMLPVPPNQDENERFASAFFEISLALDRIDPASVTDMDVDELAWTRTLKQALDTTGIKNDGRGLHINKIERMTYEQKCDFRNAIESLEYRLRS